jgi:asparagine synthase (glutamine-hydrolysing)
MCGILALIMKGQKKINDEDRSHLESLTDLMKHRGPDGRGSFTDGFAFLGHRRLAIIDLSDAGLQPMTANDGMSHIVFNGEIYNYLELKQELVKEGVEFRTKSDTEVLLELISRKGVGAISDLNGMFGFVLYNEKKKEIIAVRDRIGIKPLYYTESNDFIAISSEIKPLLQLLDEISINDGIVYDFLQRKRVEHTNSTFFNGIHQLLPGHYLIVRKSNLEIHKWYKVENGIAMLQNNAEFKNRTLSEHIKEVQRRFKRSVELRLRSDVPVGSCLSGGIDSSSIVVTAIQMIDQEQREIFQTYSAIFGDWYKKDERRYIESVIASKGIKGNFTIPTSKELRLKLHDFINCQEEPVTGAAPFSQYCVMELANANRAKVLLDGQGSDEILAGYDYMVGYYLAELLYSGRFVIFLKELLAQIRRNNHFFIRTFLAHFMPGWLQRYVYSRKNRLMNKEFWNKFRNREVLKPIIPKPPRLRTALVEYVTKNIQHLLKWEDRSSMAFSIETRLPFLDPNFMEYVLALPPGYAIKNGVTKWILRKALSDKLPPIIANRTDKIGFGTPESTWMASGQFLQFTKLIERQHPRLRSYIDIFVLKRILGKKISSLDSGTLNYLFRITLLNEWLNNFFPVRAIEPSEPL